MDVHVCPVALHADELQISAEVSRILEMKFSIAADN